MRCFVAIWPPPSTCQILGELCRPAVEGIRWTRSDRWHVTLVFLGEVAGPEGGRYVGAVEEAAASVATPPVAVLGPATAVLGRDVLCAPVAGLDPIAAAARDALSRRGLPFDPTPYVGHLTLARSGRRGRPGLHRLAGSALAASWPVGELCLVASRVGPGGGRYETLASVAVGRPAGPA